MGSLQPVTRQRILLIDDNPGDADLATEWLDLDPSCTFVIVHRTTRRAGLAYISDEVVDAVILDLHLPDSVGFETLISIKQLAPETPVILVSSMMDDNLRAEARTLGAEDVFAKDETNSSLFSRSVLLVIERNRAREQHRRLQHLLDTTPDAILLANQAGVVIYVNRAALVLFDRPSARLIGEPFGFSFRDGKPLEINIPHGDGPRVCEMRVVQMEWDGEAAYMATIRDLTESRRAEQLRARSAELESQNLRIQEASRLKSEFLANMSHEIRTPMNAIIGLSYLLAQTPLEQPQESMLGKIQGASRSLLALINDVLDLSKIEAGQFQLEDLPFDLPLLIREVSQLLSPQAEAKKLDLIIQVAQDVPRMLSGDVTRVRQILVNLLSNAVKFTDQGRVELTISCGELLGERAMVLCSVRDTGIGVEPELQKRLFNTFTQADASTTRRFGGTGLGLSIVKHVAELMGGGVGMTSELGVGSEFWVTLPLRAVTELAAADARALHTIEAVIVKHGSCRQGTIRAAVRALGWHGDRLEVGEAPHTALAQLRQRIQCARPPSVLIVDARHGQVEPLETIRCLAAETDAARLPPVVLIGSRSAVEIDGAIVLDGAISAATLFAAVQAAMRLRGLDLDQLAQCTDVDATQTHWLPGTHLIVVDDNDVNRDVAQAILQRQGAAVQTCCDGTQLLELLRFNAHTVDAVLMDVQMPEMDGCEATRRIRRDLGLSNLPILALTAGALVTERQRAFESGMNDFISKPFDPHTLVRVVRRHVQRARGTALEFRSVESRPDNGIGTWPHIEGIDSHDVEARLGKDVVMFASMLTRLVRDCDELLSENAWPAVWDAPGRIAAAARVHKLRGSLGMLGAKKLQQHASGLEAALKAGAPMKYIEVAIPAFVGELRHLVDHSRPFLETFADDRQHVGMASSSAAPMDFGAGRRLAKSLVTQNLSARRQFDELAAELRTALGAEAYQQMHAAMQNFDFALAARIFSTHWTGATEAKGLETAGAAAD